jgi:hypothetical protein
MGIFMDWLKPLDEYCERVEPGVWAEPLNAFSNLAFLFAALLAFQMCRQQSAGRGAFWLTGLVAAVGVGSFLYHTFANLWSMFADIIPIYLFQISLVVLYGAAFADLYAKPKSAGVTIVLLFFVALTFVFFKVPREIANGSFAYASSLITLILLAICQYYSSDRRSTTLLLASALFALAIVFRTMDDVVCHHFQLGTHFLWHGMNAVVLFLAVCSYLQITRPVSKAS